MLEPTFLGVSTQRPDVPRVIVHDETGPLKLDEDDIDPEKGDVAICLCGLSESYPYCDGSHRATADEDDGTLYEYDDAGCRREVEIVRADE